MYGDSKASIGSLFGRDGDGRPDGAVGRGLLLTPREVQTETATHHRGRGRTAAGKASTQLKLASVSAALTRPRAQQGHAARL